MVLTEEVKNWNNYCGVTEDETPANEMDFDVVKIIPLIFIAIVLAFTTTVIMKVMKRFEAKVQSARSNLIGNSQPEPSRRLRIGSKWAGLKRASGDRLSGHNLSAEHAEDYSSQANDDSIDDFDEDFIYDEKRT